MKSTGFTIVEMLIIIVVIAIIAAITIVAYNGVTSRAAVSKMDTDFALIRKGLQLYKVDHGDYPNSEDCVNVDSNYNWTRWCGWNQGTNDSFIPGLAPEYIPTVPNLDKGNRPNYDTYLYKSANNDTGSVPGTRDYQLIRYNSDGVPAYELTNNPNTWTTEGYTGLAWGFKSDPSQPNW